MRTLLTTLAATALFIPGAAAAHDMHGIRHWHSRVVSDSKPRFSCQIAWFIVIDDQVNGSDGRYDQDLTLAYEKAAECRKRTSAANPCSVCVARLASPYEAGICRTSPLLAAGAETGRA